MCQNPSSWAAKRERNCKEHNEWRENVNRHVDTIEVNPENGPQQSERFVEAVAEQVTGNGSYDDSRRYSLENAHGLSLTSIVPNYCVFKDVILGSNPVDFSTFVCPCAVFSRYGI